MTSASFGFKLYLKPYYDDTGRLAMPCVFHGLITIAPSGSSYISQFDRDGSNGEPKLLPADDDCGYGDNEKLFKEPSLHEHEFDVRCHTLDFILLDLFGVSDHGHLGFVRNSLDRYMIFVFLVKGNCYAHLFSRMHSISMLQQHFRIFFAKLVIEI